MRGLVEESHSGQNDVTAHASTSRSGQSELEALDMSFTVNSCTGETKSLSGVYEKVVDANVHQYIAQAINYRLQSISIGTYWCKTIEMARSI